MKGCIKERIKNILSDAAELGCTNNTLQVATAQLGKALGLSFHQCMIEESRTRGNFKFYVVTRSYSSHLFLCALVRCFVCEFCYTPQTGSAHFL